MVEKQYQSDTQDNLSIFQGLTVYFLETPKKKQSPPLQKCAKDPFNFSKCQSWFPAVYKKGMCNLAHHGSCNLGINALSPNAQTQEKKTCFKRFHPSPLFLALVVQPNQAHLRPGASSIHCTNHPPIAVKENSPNRHLRLPDQHPSSSGPMEIWTDGTDRPLGDPCSKKKTGLVANKNKGIEGID